MSHPNSFTYAKDVSAHRQQSVLHNEGKNDEAFDMGGQLLTNIPTWPVATTLGNLGC